MNDMPVACQSRAVTEPQRDAVSRRLTEGSPGGRECQWVKEKAGYRTPLSLRGQFANWPWQSASLLRHARNTAVSRRNGFPRRFAPRNDSGCLGRLFLFPSALDSTLETPSALRTTSPKRGSATRQEFNTGATGQRSAPFGAPAMGAAAQATEESPDDRKCH